MSTALATQNYQLADPSIASFTAQQLQMITDTIMKGATAEEVSFFAEVCKRAKLDPFRKQIHAVNRWDNQLQRKVWSYQTGIDGYRAIAHRTGVCAGIEEPKFLPADESTPHPTKATATVWKIVGGQRVPFTASARWDEYVQTTKDGKPNSMWSKMAYGQLGKCAEALALRKAFPEELGGIYTDVEMEQADSQQDRQPQAPTGSRFDLESRPFEKPAEQPASPAVVTTVEAEVVNDPVDTTGIPEGIAELVGGAWKNATDSGLLGDGVTLGSLKTADLTRARNDMEAPLADALSASYIDEIRFRLSRRNISQDHLAEAAVEAKIANIEFPADLWSFPEEYPALLEFAKSLR
jgi:phage recombination protein Bet